MTFPKAENGIKKIYIAQLLSVIGAAIESLTAIYSIFSIVIFGNVFVTSPLIVSITIAGLSLVSLSLMTIGFFLTLSGLFRAKADDENFKVALYSVVFSIGIQLVGIIWAAYNEVLSITNLLTTVTSFLSSAYVILGIRSLASKLDCIDIDEKGKKCYNFITVIFFLMTFSDVAILIFNGTEWVDIVSYLKFADGVFSLVQFIVIMLYLKKSHKMLATH